MSNGFFFWLIFVHGESGCIHITITHQDGVVADLYVEYRTVEEDHFFSDKGEEILLAVVIPFGGVEPVDMAVAPLIPCS